MKECCTAVIARYEASDPRCAEIKARTAQGYAPIALYCRGCRARIEYAGIRWARIAPEEV